MGAVFEGTGFGGLLEGEPHGTLLGIIFCSPPRCIWHLPHWKICLRVRPDGWLSFAANCPFAQEDVVLFGFKKNLSLLDFFLPGAYSQWTQFKVRGIEGGLKAAVDPHPPKVGGTSKQQQGFSLKDRLRIPEHLDPASLSPRQPKYVSTPSTLGVFEASGSLSF